jgi:uncharacterized protein YjbI with pentapeptide repeats
MSEASRAGLETETPVNPYSLLEAVNNSSDTAHTAWLIFIAVMAYLMVAVAGVTHKDLLLETPVNLPILQVSIQLAQFFQFAPVLLVLFHLGVVSQLVLLARKTLEFDHAVQALELTSRRTHPLRLELHNFFFVQAIAGPHRSAVMSMFLHGMSWLTLVILPVVLLLYIQIKFLPYHDVAITWTHRVALLVDIAMLVLIGVFLMRAETSFFAAFFRTTVHHPLSFLVTFAVMAAAAFFSFLVATVPGEALDRMTLALLGTEERASSGRSAAQFDLPFLRPRADGSLWGMFYRNLIVTDVDLVKGAGTAAGESTISLRGRDLRFAVLDRSDLSGADMTGANLESASLIGADLSRIRLQCADIDKMRVTEDREAADCAGARGADLTRARLAGASLAGVDLRGAKLRRANLEGAVLSDALLTEADFSEAQMAKVNLSGGAQLQRANFLIASLQGADLSGAKLQFADFSSASLQGAFLQHAGLEGAVLRDADLEGADLQMARLQGADLAGAKLRAADLRGASVWMTEPPAPQDVLLADMRGLVIKPMEADEASALESAIGRIESAPVQRRLKAQAKPMADVATSRTWAATPALQTWQSLVAVTNSVPRDAYGGQLTEHLAGLMCKARWSSGAVATGVVKRAQGAQFQGNMVAIYDRLRGKDCPAGASVPGGLMQALSSAVDIAKEN